jgi:hypothetical protein
VASPGWARCLIHLSGHLANAASALPLAAFLAAFAVLNWIALPIIVRRIRNHPNFLASNFIRILGLCIGLYSVVFGVLQSTSGIVLVGWQFCWALAAHSFTPRFFLPQLLASLQYRSLSCYRLQSASILQGST